MKNFFVQNLNFILSINFLNVLGQTSNFQNKNSEGKKSICLMTNGERSKTKFNV